MRRGHALDVCFDGSRIAGGFGQDIEVGQVATGAVEEEAENLLEYLIDGRALGVLAHGPKEAIDVGKKVNATKVASKEVESGPARLVRQPPVTWTSSMDFALVLFELSIRPSTKWVKRS
jgi:hypothetical protein